MIPHRLLLASALLLSISLALVAAEPATAPAPASAPAAPDLALVDETPASLATSRQLNTPVRVLPGSFEKCINALRDASGASFDVRWKALETAAVDRNTQVDLNLREVSIRRSLVAVLSEAGGGSTPLGYVIDDGVVTISTTDDLDARYQTTRTYDIQDLLLASAAPGARIQLPQLALGSGSSDAPGARSGGGGLFGPDTAATIAELVALIAETIEPASWRTIDNMPGTGTIGTIRELHGQLVVNQTPRAHTQIARLLADRRQSVLSQISVRALVVSLPAPIETYLADGKTTPAQSPDFLDAAVVDKLREKILADPKAALLAAPRALVLNGQSALLSAATALVSPDAPGPSASALEIAAARVPQSDSIVVALRIAKPAEMPFDYSKAVNDLVNTLAPTTTTGPTTTSPTTTTAPATIPGGGVFGPGEPATPAPPRLAQDLRVILPAHKYAVLGGLPRTTDTKPPIFVYTLLTAHPIPK